MRSRPAAITARARGKRAFGGRAEITLADGRVLADEIAVADAHPASGLPATESERLRAVSAVCFAAPRIIQFSERGGSCSCGERRSSRRCDRRGYIVRPAYPMLTACHSVNGAVGQFQLARSVVLLDRLEVVMKSPVREAYPEVAGGDIGEAEMNTQPNSCVDDVCAQGTPAVVVAGDSGDGC